MLEGGHNSGLAMWVTIGGDAGKTAVGTRRDDSFGCKGVCGGGEYRICVWLIKGKIQTHESNRDSISINNNGGGSWYSLSLSYE